MTPLRCYTTAVAHHHVPSLWPISFGKHPFGDHAVHELRWFASPCSPVAALAANKQMQSLSSTLAHLRANERASHIYVGLRAMAMCVRIHHIFFYWHLANKVFTEWAVRASLSGHKPLFIGPLCRLSFGFQQGSGNPFDSHTCLNAMHRVAFACAMLRCNQNVQHCAALCMCSTLSLAN